jgi:D-serine deaminase-like pyridoxal phosphate-dependent protein
MSDLAQTDWDAVATPALTIDVPRLEANIAETAGAFAAADVALRPHFKTSKCLEVAGRQRDAGAVGFTCSTPAEVEALAAAGFENLLYAHLPVGPVKVDAAAGLAGRHGVTLLVDSVAVARPLAAACRDAGVTAAYLLDVDTGHHRTGVDPERAVAVAREIEQLEGLRLAGVLTHEGHVGGYAGDRPRLEQAAVEAGALLASVADDLRTAGLDCRTVSVGSTPGIRSAPYQPGVTEGRPGTYVYYDGNQVRLGGADWDRCASTVLTRVVSVNRDGTAITDAGIKAMSSDTITPENGVGTLVDVAGRRLPELAFVSGNEEHGFVAGTGLQVGDLLRVVPHHACGASNMWSRVLAIHADGRTESWAVVARH